MSSLSPIRYQCRNADSIYMFQLNSKELSLKILSISKEVLFNRSFSQKDLPFLGFEGFLLEEEVTSVLEQLVTSHLLPKKHFPSTPFKEVVALAEILKESGKIKDVVHAYYKEAVEALFEKNTQRLSLCTREIRQIDPQMEHLSTDQKVHLLTQEQIATLSEELKETRKELHYMKRLKAFDLMDTIKNPRAQASQRENAIDFLKNVAAPPIEYELAIKETLFGVLEDPNAGLFVKMSALEFLEKLLKHSVSDEERQRLRLLLRHQSDARITSTMVNLIKRESPFLDEAFGKKDWEAHFGSIGETPPLPSDIERILNSPCPFHQGALVRETHILVLMPQKISGKFLTLNAFADLIVQFPEERRIASSKHKDGNNRLKKSYWMLMTKDPIPGSINTHGEEKMELINKYSSYKLPTPLEAAAGITMYYLRHGKRIYSFYTVCPQNGSAPNVNIGGSSGGGYYCDETAQGGLNAGITGVLRL